MTAPPPPSRLLFRTTGAIALALMSLGAVRVLAESDETVTLRSAKDEARRITANSDRLGAAVRDAPDEPTRARLAVAALNARIAAAEADVHTAEARIAAVDQLGREQRARLAAKQQGIARLVGAIQTLARRPAAYALMQPGSITDAAHVQGILAAALPEMQRRTAGVREEIIRARQLRRDADAALAELQRTQLRLIDRRQELAAMEARLSGGPAVSPAEVQRALVLGERARDAIDLISTIDDQEAVRRRLATLDGPLPRPPGLATDQPVAAPAPSLLSRLWGAKATRRPVAYALPADGAVVTGMGEVSDAGVPERGIGIAAAAEAPVIAPNRGHVAFAGPYRSFGLIVIIDHGKRWFTLITGMGSLSVRKGDDVTRGQLLGRAIGGDRGVTVELRRQGVPVDLTPLLRRG